MNQTPIEYSKVKEVISSCGFENVGKASIRELAHLVDQIEEKTGEKFIRMEMGVPGLSPASVGIEAEIDALRKGVASSYPSIEGIQYLKNEASRFIKLFMNIDLDPEGCLPTVGSMMGAMAAFMVANRTDRNKEGTLFIDPGFPVQKHQCRVLGQKYQSFDVYNFRGKKLKEKLESYLTEGKISTILYSNPNNPTWMCLSEEELQIIGELSTKYDITVIEDLAYFAMDFRVDMSIPGKAPFQPTVGNYTDNYILLISSSKAFSYAGQRVGVIAVSNTLFNRTFPDLLRFFSSDNFGHSLIYGAIYALSAGTSHSSQYALAAILEAANNGKYNFVNDLREYGAKAKIMKELFIKYGFKIVYDMDMDVPIADGFYFTISYPGFMGVNLLEELLFYGISAISLDITGSNKLEGLRACVSQVSRSQFPILEERLKRFQTDHLIK